MEPIPASPVPTLIPPTPPAQHLQPVQAKSAFWNIFLLSLVTLSIGAAVGYLYAMSQIPKQITPPITPTPTATPTASISSAPTPTISTSSWKTQTFQIQSNTASGIKNRSLEIKIPSDWGILTTTQPNNPDYSIVTCPIYSISDNQKLVKLTLKPICTGWGAVYSSWPPDAVIVMQQNGAGNDGPRVEYRVRYAISPSTFNYVDATTYIDQPLDKTKDQIMDALMVRYAPPNEDKDDFYFFAANLIAVYSGPKEKLNDYLSIADQIAASITLR